MDHCKDKKRHKWEKLKSIGGVVEGVVCKICGKIKRYKTHPTGRKWAKGAFGNNGS